MLLIEQNAETALSIAHRGVILVKGRVVASGKASELLDNDAGEAPLLANTLELLDRPG